MANEQKTEPKSGEKDKQKLPARDDKSKGKGADDQTASEAPLDPEDEAFINKNK